MLLILVDDDARARVSWWMMEMFVCVVSCDVVLFECMGVNECVCVLMEYFKFEDEEMCGMYM